MILVVADASSIILLEKMCLLDILLGNAVSFLIPPEVRKEAVEKGKMKKHPDAFKIEEKITAGKIAVKEVHDAALVKNLMLSFNIESGEAEAIVLFKQEQADLLATDDRLALNACRALTIPAAGSAAFIIHTFEKGFISLEQGIQMLEILAKEGRYKDDIIFSALRKIQGGHT